MTDSNKNLHLILRLWHEYISPYRYKIILAFAFMVVYSITTGAVVKFLEPVVDDVFKNEDLNMLQWLSAGVLITFIIKGLSSYGQGILLNDIGQSIIADLQNKIFEKIARADIAFFSQNKTGRLISFSTYHITMIRNLIAQIITSLGKDSLTLFVLVGLMFYQDYKLASVALIVLPFSIIPLSKTGRKMRKISGSTQSETGDWVSYLTQVFQGIKIVKSYNMESTEEHRAKTYIDTLKQYAIKSGRAKASVSPIMETLGGLAIVIIIGYGGWQVIKGYNTAGAFFSFIAALLMTYEPMKKLANLHTNLQEGLAAATDVFSILDHQKDIQNKPGATELSLPAGEIKFDNVSFSYDDQPTLTNLSFTIPAKKHVALVGPSGAGKSTLFNLLLRFYDPQQGDIQIDGQSITDVTIESLRHNIALVSQDVVLFHGSIRENICYGSPEATDQKIQQAIQKSACDEFIKNLPQGLETQIGERGLKLSGGQKQRISIARAFLKNAPILLLDEATSSLDSSSEKIIQNALADLTENRTTLTIAHRLSTVKDADQILVFDQGRLVQKGPHKQLIATKGLYQNLCALQFNSQS
jgi:subfamily B ATP-binding cassette protein MsbA